MKHLHLLLCALLIFVSFQSYFFVNPTKLNSAALTSVSVTLANSRLSYFGEVGTASLAGDSTVAIRTSGGSGPDLNSTHLFPGDTVNVGPNGAKTVATIIDGTNFALSTPLTVGAPVGGSIFATQSGVVTVAFTLASQIPANGYLRITIPDPAANGNDGAPNTAATLALNGWDLNGVSATDITVSGGTGCNWNATETVTAGTGSGHTIDATTTTACTAGTVTATIGSTKNLVNPAKISAGHSVGTADYYQWNVATWDSNPATGALIDQTDVSVAVIEGVLISATVDETLTFSIAGVSADSGTTGTCGITRTASTPDSSSVAVPWGTLSPGYTAATHNASQLLTVTTNADGGYAVTAIANDQMGKDGKACTTTEDGDESCIKDTACGASPCSHTAPIDWTADPSSYPGLGYSLEEVTTGAASFEYNDTGTFYAKQFADQQAGQPAQTIMTEAGPVDTSQVYVCYRIDITVLQPAGYYYNKVRYTATSTF